MKRQWRIWIAFALALAVLLGAMGSVSLTVLRLDRAEADARRQAALEENVRLALWRMDSNLAPLIAQENARPYFAYGAFYPAERAYTRMFSEIQRGEVIVPSPLLTEASEHILLHFQFGPAGSLTSPQVPAGNMLDLAESVYTTQEKIEASAARLASLRSRLNLKALLAAFPEAPAQQEQTVEVVQQEGAQSKPSPAQQELRNLSEYQARARSYQQAASQFKEMGTVVAKPHALCEALMRPLWVGDMLILARKVEANGGGYVQGCWLDWPAIQKWLGGSIRDLLPNAALAPLSEGGSDPRARVLASLPVRLEPGPLPEAPAPFISPIRISLFIAWGCVVVAAGAVAVLLLGAVSLSERRATFVSAVTHELRTPLTTFQLYSEMLAEGMVQDEAKRLSYLRTLCSEADRLSHLVENVLAYARLERGRARGRVEEIALGDLLARTQDRLARRAEQAGMTLAVEAAGDATDVRVRADGSAVDQILLNLVDNACKYADGAEDKRIHLEAVRSAAFRPCPRGAREAAAIRVRDHGPGISAEGRQRLFRPFSKSATEAAHSAPGVGLGLALSRRLARDMGGDLCLDGGSAEGACFVLTLPVA